MKKVQSRVGDKMIAMIDFSTTADTLNKNETINAANKDRF